MLRQLLLLPLLAPLLAVIVVGALNPKPSVSLRLLTYTSPPLPIGVWMMLAAAGGGLVSAGTTGLALRSGSSQPNRRQVRLPLGAEPTRVPWSAPASSATASRPGREETPSGEPPGPETMAAAPSRAPGEPAPTVEVPFRVIRRASSSSAVGDEPSTGSTPVDDWDDSGSDW